MLVPSLRTCSALPAGMSHRCYWSSRAVANRPSDSLSLMRPNGVGWDWRHRFYELKKHYLLELVRLGYGVLQADTDTIWAFDPFPMLLDLRQTYPAAPLPHLPPKSPPFDAHLHRAALPFHRRLSRPPRRPPFRPVSRGIQIDPGRRSLPTTPLISPHLMRIHV